MDRATTPKINLNLYSVPMIFMLNIQNDLSTKAKVITTKPLCLQTDS